MIDKFGGNQLVMDAFIRSEIDVKNELDRLAMKSYSYYKKDMIGIRNFLTSYLLSIINVNSLNKMPRVIMNYIPKMVKRLTLAYVKSPLSETTTNKEEYLHLTRNLNKYRKEFHRQGKLFNTILVRPIYKEDKELFEYMILSRAHCNVITDLLDKKKIKEVNYKVEYENRQGNIEDYTIHWTDEKHWATDKNDNDVKLDFMPDDQVNPYGEIPFVALHIEDTMDFWGDGMNDIVQANEHLNARLTDIFFKMYMSFGVPLGTNLNIKSNEFYLSPDMPIMIDNSRAEMSPPSLQFITPDQKVELDKVVQDWFINEMGVSQGLPAGAFSEKETANSGYSKMIDNLELLDLNEDDKDALREFEYELFEMQKIVLETDSTKSIKGDLKFEFIPFEFPKSDQEIWLNREKEFQYDISTPVDWMRSYRPEASNEDLLAKLLENKQTNGEVKRTLTRLESLNNASGRTAANQ